jgi:hypothetical protein
MPLLHAAQSVETSTEPTEEILSPDSLSRQTPTYVAPAVNRFFENNDKMRTSFRTRSENRHFLAQIKADMTSYARSTRFPSTKHYGNRGLDANATRFSPRRGNAQEGKIFQRATRQDHRNTNSPHRRLIHDDREEDGDC